MRRIKLSILLMGLFIGIKTWGQDRPEESLAFISGITTNSDLYNGSVNVNIPLFTIPVGNLALSNELSNSALGFRPNIDESMYGLHWSSNQFGVITRDTQKDFLLTGYSFLRPEDGIAVIVASDESKNKELLDCTVQRQKFDYGFVASKKKILQDPLNSGLQERFIPDKFYFDFFGYKGYFTFDNHGTPLVFCETAKLKVIIPAADANKCYWVNGSIDFQNKNVTELKMIDDKGNTFYFGGTFDDLEINYSQFNYSGTYYNPVLQMNKSFYSASRANYIVSWFLKKVELNNGDIIEAQYKHGNADIYSAFTQKSLINNGETFPNELPNSSQREAANIEVSTSYEILPTGYDLYVTVTNTTKRAILENIKVIGKDISINYNYFRDTNRLLHLSNINLNYFGKSEDITFNQVPLGGQFYRYFLTSLTNNGKVYSFEYYNTANLPDKKLKATNDFGFWNGGSYKGVGDSNNFLDATLLKKIVYPTKGYTIFNREKADVSKKWFTDYSLLSTEASMSRITSKLDFDGTKQYITNYTYKLYNGKSSGILQPKGNNGKITSQQINYSQVQEKQVNKGMTDYFYSDVNSNPDDNSIKKFTGSSGSNNLYFNNQYNREYQRGKLLNKKVYDNNNLILREHQYVYQSFLRPESDLQDLANCTTCKISDDGYYVMVDIDRSFNQNHVATRYEPVIPYLLKNEKVIDYVNSKQFILETNTKFRESNLFWHPYPEEISFTSPEGTSIKRILYAHDVRVGGCRTGCPVNETIVGGQQPMYESMVNSNIMFPVLEIDKNQNNKYSLTENLYYTMPFLLKKTRKSKLDAALNFTSYNINVDKTTDGTTCDLIDSKANCIQSTDKFGVSTVILYGYKQTVPIAKIVGVKYAQLMQILGQQTGSASYLNLDIVNKSDQDINAASELLLLNSLDLFKNNALLKEFSITTYTYDPLVGVKTITPPSGIKEFYIYDSDKKLKEVRENSVNGNILKDYKYNYKN